MRTVSLGGQWRGGCEWADRAGSLVYHLTAKFGPASLRDFVTLALTTTGADEQGGPRHFMIVSKPCQHDSCPPQDGQVRGEYESVEFIREIKRAPKRSSSTLDLPSAGRDTDGQLPLEKVRTTPAGGEHETSEKTRSRGKSVSFADFSKNHGSSSTGSDPPAVEWIHITRSRPGGSVPMWMVERGTPAGICSDAGKFVDWLSKQETSTDEPKESDRGTTESANGIPPEDGPSEAPATEPTRTEPDPPQGTFLQVATSSATTAFGKYAPAALTRRLTPSPKPSADPSEPSSPSSVSSGSFASAEELHALSPRPSLNSLNSGTGTTTSNAAATPEERATARLAKKQADLEARLAKARDRPERERESTAEREAGRWEKAQARHQKELAKVQAAHEKELKDLQAKKERRARKEEEKAAKARRKEEQEREKREKEDVRRQLELVTSERDVLRKENEVLTREKERLAEEVKALKGGSDIAAAASSEKS